MDCSVHRLVADIALLAQRQTLMVRYRDTSNYDHQTGWFLPDDFLQFGEHPEEAATRIAREQAGLAVNRTRLASIESFTGGPSRSWHLIFHYVAELEEATPVEAAGNIKDARWFGLDDLPSASEVAHHGWALDVLNGILARGAPPS
jgi:ADP-ribose pyrophosphatase YjhB (NUDIX family)